MRKLNLGSGGKHKDGYINIDADWRGQPEIVRDITRGLPFDDNSVDEIYSSHFLEHLKPDDLIFVIREIQRVLKEGCEAILKVPLGVAPDMTHESFFHKRSFANLLQQYTKYSLPNLEIVWTEVIDMGDPDNYDQLTVMLRKIDRGKEKDKALARLK